MITLSTVRHMALREKQQIFFFSSLSWYHVSTQSLFAKGFFLFYQVPYFSIITADFSIPLYIKRGEKPQIFINKLLKFSAKKKKKKVTFTGTHILLYIHNTNTIIIILLLKLQQILILLKSGQ